MSGTRLIWVLGIPSPRCRYLLLPVRHVVGGIVIRPNCAAKGAATITPAIEVLRRRPVRVQEVHSGGATMRHVTTSHQVVATPPDVAASRGHSVF